MTTMVDTRGLACPQPVIQTRKAMQAADQLVTLVDNETALTNVSRMAAKAGWQVDVTSQGDEYRIQLTKGTSLPQTAPLQVGRAEAAGEVLSVYSWSRLSLDGELSAALGSEPVPYRPRAARRWAVARLRDADRQDATRKLAQTYAIWDRMAGQIANVVLPQRQFLTPRDSRGVLTAGNYGTACTYSQVEINTTHQ